MLHVISSACILTYNIKIMAPSFRNVGRVTIFKFIYFFQTEEEYRAQYTCVRRSSSAEGDGDKEESYATPIYTAPPNLTLPEAMDWHTKGAVSSVMNQVSI